MRNINVRKLFLYLLIASVSLSALIGIIVILFGNFGEIEVKVLLTALTITVTSILGLACGAYLESGRGRYLPIAGIFFALASAVMWLVIIWYRGQPNEWFPKTTATTTILALASAHLSLLSLARLNSTFLWAHYAAHTVLWGLAGFLIFTIWAEPKDEEWVGRVTGVLGILAGSVTLITPVFHKLSAGESNSDDIDAEIRLLRDRIAELEKRKVDRLTN